jgi:hypothetical protein
MTRIHGWVLCALLFLLTAVGSASAATVCVDTKPKAGCYPTITAGIAAAQPGDPVNVAHGTYPVDATQNWWGCPRGPGALGCSTKSDNVTANSWLSKPAND